MTEEEIIKKVKYYISVYDEVSKDCEWYDAEEQESAKEQLEFTQGLLDLYNKQKQEAEHYRAENSIRDKSLFNIAEKVGITKCGITESMIINAIDNNYISKNKIIDNIKELEILKMTSFANNEISKQVYKEQIDLINMQINVLKNLLEE